jgi:hypothetical protein
MRDRDKMMENVCEKLINYLSHICITRLCVYTCVCLCLEQRRSDFMVLANEANIIIISSVLRDNKRVNLLDIKRCCKIDNLIRTRLKL